MAYYLASFPRFMEREACSREEAEQHIKQIREGRGFVDGSEANSTNVNREDLEASISMYDTSTPPAV